ncbi:MAG TPA: M67 family metallopeptidase [Azonexus sp.]
MPHILQLPPAVRAGLHAQAAAGYPAEACGLLLGVDSDGQCRVARQHPAHNLNRERAGDRFELDPQDYLAAEAAATAAGMAVVGIWHSHPDHPARPSETDRALAWPGWSYVILAVHGGEVVDLRSWRLAGEDFCEEEVRHG